MGVRKVNCATGKGGISAFSCGLTLRHSMAVPGSWRKAVVGLEEDEADDDMMMEIKKMRGRKEGGSLLRPYLCL